MEGGGGESEKERSRAGGGEPRSCGTFRFFFRSFRLFLTINFGIRPSFACPAASGGITCLILAYDERPALWQPHQHNGVEGRLSSAGCVP